MEKKLYRDEHHKVIGGVCAGLSEYFSIDISIIRVLFVLTVLLHGSGGLLYIILWIVLPKKPFVFGDLKVDYTTPPQPGQPLQPGQPFQPSAPFGKTPKRTSTGGIIIGVILIIMGAGFLLNEFDIIPDWDYGQLWPVIIVVAGIALIAAGRKKPQPWEQPNWHTADKKEEPTNDNSINDTPPTV